MIYDDAAGIFHNIFERIGLDAVLGVCGYCGWMAYGTHVGPTMYMQWLEEKRRQKG